jgi:hypothetical protein
VKKTKWQPFYRRFLLVFSGYLVYFYAVEGIYFNKINVFVTNQAFYNILPDTGSQKAISLLTIINISHYRR